MKLSSVFTFLIAIAMLQTTILKAQIIVTANTDSIGMYDVYELTIVHPQSYNNNWEDVTLSTLFTGPQTITIAGFFYNNNIWKVRFAPPKMGNWNFNVTFTTPSNIYTSSGTLVCIKSGTKGFLQKHPTNPFRLIFPDGTLFNGIGIGDCILDINGNGTPHDDWGFDGDIRPPGEVRPYPLYSGKSTTLDTYMKAYGTGGAGFNLFRWSTDNCSFRLYNSITTTGNYYSVQTGAWGDTLVQTLRKNNIRLWLTFFGPPIFNNINGQTPLEEAALKRYIGYVVARFGAYTDIWELFNEAFCSDYYIQTVTDYLHAIDPFHRLVSVSAERPDYPAIDINSPHWYERENELESDIRAWDMITNHKKWNKPVIFGEQGNSIGNWDTRSSVRMRIRSWTSFFAEGNFIFWNASWTKEYMNDYAANIYLGPEERGYIKAMQSFTSLADSAVKPITITANNFYDVRGYGVKSENLIMGYFHHYSSHTDNVSTSFDYRMRKGGTVYWINPANNTIISSQHLDRGKQTIISPSFNIDIAMRINIDTGAILVDVNKKLDILIYPNPATNEFILEGNFNKPVIIELFDEAGKKIFSKKNIGNNQRISTGGVPNGIYFYKVISADTRQDFGKIVIFR